MSPWRPRRRGLGGPSRSVRPRAARVLEKTEQAHIVQLAQTVGCAVTVYGTARRGSRCPKCGEWVAGHRGTQQSLGIPDLEIWIPQNARLSIVLNLRRVLVKWEVKSEVRARAKSGGLSVEQLAYRDLCDEAGVIWRSGSFNDFIAFLVDQGIAKAENVPHYRLSATGAEGR